MLANPAIKGQMDRPQGGRSIPPSERGRSTAFAPALRRGKCCRVGVLRSALGFADHRGRELTPTPLPPTKSGVADLPLSVSGGCREWNIFSISHNVLQDSVLFRAVAGC